MTASNPFNGAFRREVQARCAAFERLTDEADIALKRAAVGIVLVEADDGSGEAAFLLTQRAPTLRSHGGQFALPGGRVDNDETAVETVIREVAEELGLVLGPQNVLGVLDDYPTRSGYIVTPVVIWAEESSGLTPNPDEVSDMHRVSLRVIMTPDAFQFVDIPESDRPVIRVLINGLFIHAPTTALLYQFRELLEGRTTRVAGVEQPVFAWR